MKNISFIIIRYVIIIFIFIYTNISFADTNKKLYTKLMLGYSTGPFTIGNPRDPNIEEIEATIKYKDHFKINGAVGYNVFNPKKSFFGLDVEIDLGYQTTRSRETKFMMMETIELQNKKDDSLYKIFTAMVNLVPSFQIGSIRPYLLAGLGINRMRYVRASFDEEVPTPEKGIGTYAAWQIGTGMEYKLNNYLSLLMDYRYISLSGYSRTYNTDDGNVFVNLDIGSTSAFMTGLKYNF